MKSLFPQTGLFLSLAAIAGFALPVIADQGDLETRASRAVVEETLGQVLDLLNSASLSEEERRSQIEGLLYGVFDFDSISKLVLARNWKKFNEAQRREFISEFKSYLSRNYGNRLDRYRQTDVEVYGARVEPRGDVTVLSKVVGGEFDGIEMNYRMRLRTGQWKVIDIVIEGVSLLANFRSQFGEIVNRGGPESLLEKMKNKNLELKPQGEDTSS